MPSNLILIATPTIPPALSTFSADGSEGDGIAALAVRPGCVFVATHAKLPRKLSDVFHDPYRRLHELENDEEIAGEVRGYAAPVPRRIGPSPIERCR